MKKINYLIISCLLFITFTVPQNVYAENYKTYDVVSISDNSYTIKCSVMNGSTMDLNDICYAGQPLKNYVFTASAMKDGNFVVGNFYWDNPNYIIVSGEQIVKLMFNDYYKNKIVTCDVYLYGLEQPKKVTDDPFDDTIGTPKSEESVEDTATALTVSNLILADEATYDINLVNRDLDSSYSWTTSNSKVAKVSKSSGVVTGLSDGTAKITCKASDGTVLTSEVTVVTDDENLPMLTENDLDLSVGELVDINVDNSIAKSTYKWTSTNKSVAKVTSKTGKVTALKTGTATIQCVIKTPQDKIIVLKSDVTIE
jgi:hypothetical protein